MHQEARNWTDTGTDAGRKCMSYEFAAAKAREHGFGPDSKQLQIREEQYLKQFEVPEWAELRRAKVKAYAADTWFLDEYFRQHGVNPKNPLSDMEPDALKAFQVVPGELTVFPFFWDTQIVEGILAIPLLDVLIMDTVTVASGTAVHAVMSETIADRTMGETGEFGTFMELNIVSTEDTVRLKKFGGILSISDESMRRQRIPVFARGIARIGRQIGIAMTDFFLDILLNGDSQIGGSNGAATQVAAAVAGSPTYLDYVKLLLNFDIGYEPTDLVLSRQGIQALVNTPEFKDPLSGFKLQSQGVLPEAFGLMTHRWDSNGSSTWATTVGTGSSALAIQRQRAMIMYQEGGLSTESDRDARTETTFVKTSWYIAGAIWDRNAVRWGTGYA